MNCPICNKELNENQKFCPACGTKIDWQQEQPIASERTQAAEWEETTVEPAFGAAPAPEKPSAPEPSEYFPDDRQPEAEPPKQKVSIVTIIVIAGAAVLLVVGGIFFAFKLGLFGGKGDKPGKPDEPQSSTVEVTPAPAPKPASSGPESLVKRFEKALNDNDEEAMMSLFKPEDREVKAKGAFALVSGLNSFAEQAGQKLEYTCTLKNLEYLDGDDKATGVVEIAIELPIIGKKGVDSNLSFVKVDGEWYINTI